MSARRSYSAFVKARSRIFEAAESTRSRKSTQSRKSNLSNSTSHGPETWSPHQIQHAQRLIQEAMLPVLNEAYNKVRGDLKMEMQGLGKGIRQDIKKVLRRCAAEGAAASPRYAVDSLQPAPTTDLRAAACNSKDDVPFLKLSNGKVMSGAQGETPQAEEMSEDKLKSAGLGKAKGLKRGAFMTSDLAKPVDGAFTTGGPVDDLSETPMRCPVNAKGPAWNAMAPRKKPVATVDPMSDPMSDIEDEDEQQMNEQHEVCLPVHPNDPPPLLPLQVPDENGRPLSASASAVPRKLPYKSELSVETTETILDGGCQADEAAGVPTKSVTPGSPRLSENSDCRVNSAIQEIMKYGGMAAINHNAEMFNPEQLQAPGNARFSLTLENCKAGIKQQSKEEKSWKDWTARDLLESAHFDNFVGGLILINAITIGVQTDYMARNNTEEVPVVMQAFERIFLVLFTFELSLRLFVFRCRFWYMKESRLWNWFDAIVVGAQILEEIVNFISSVAGDDETNNNNNSGGSVRLLRVMRILRIMRILRVVRVLRLITELRTIVSSIAGSMKALAWTIVLLFLMIYIVGVYFTQSIMEHRLQLPIDKQELNVGNKILIEYFGDMPRTILSLYQAMSGGLDWDTLASPLITEISWVLGLTFVCYVAFAVLALLNVVTGVFVQTALMSAKEEEDNFLTDQVLNVFNNTAQMRNQTLLWEDVEEAMHNPDVSSFWKSIDVQPEEAGFLFRLLDVDRTGAVEFEEFLGACLRLRGPAKSVDLLTLMQEFRGFGRRFAAFEKVCLICLESINSTEEGPHGLKAILSNIVELSDTCEENHHLLSNMKQQLRKLDMCNSTLNKSEQS